MIEEMNPAVNPAARAEEIVQEFSFFDDWEDRYQHLIDLGRKLPPLAPDLMVEENRLRGCQSVVHLIATYERPVMCYRASSDAAIVQGLIALMLRVYSGQTPEDILKTPPEFIRRIGLDEHLSPTRKNGLAALVSAIMAAAHESESRAESG